MFNKSLNSWDVSNVTSMEYMFFNCEQFNRDLKDWRISNVTNTKDMFKGCLGM